mmetsp:Transcript_23805/g.37213  ORF Transcript_23805/g.37213 Transcript_23805/m.37213 type:complete len:213 (+) Transcript_23805:99-737(+)
MLRPLHHTRSRLEPGCAPHRCDSPAYCTIPPLRVNYSHPLNLGLLRDLNERVLVDELLGHDLVHVRGTWGGNEVLGSSNDLVEGKHAVCGGGGILLIMQQEALLCWLDLSLSLKQLRQGHFLVLPVTVRIVVRGVRLLGAFIAVLAGNSREINRGAIADTAMHVQPCRSCHPRVRGGACGALGVSILLHKEPVRSVQFCCDLGRLGLQTWCL